MSFPNFAVQYTAANPAPNPAPVAETGAKLLEGVPWFDSHWMIIATILFPVALFVIWFAFPGSLRQKLKNPYVIGWLAVPFYFSHQTEEHYYDARGWRYGFVPGFNHGVGALIFPECNLINHLLCPADVRMATYINVVATWIGFSATMVFAHYKGGRYVYAGLCNWGMCVVNALGGHLLPWMFIGYNSGAVQSIFLFSFGAWAITRDGLKFAAVCFLNGMFFHGFAFGVGINMMFKFRFLPSEFDAFLCLLTSTVFPIVLAHKFAPEKSAWYVTRDTDDEPKYQHLV